MINKKQYISLSFFLTRIVFLGGGFSLLIGTSKNNLLITSFLGMLLGYFLLYLFYRKGSISKKSILLIAIANLIMVTISTTTLTSTYLLQKSSTMFIMIAFMVTLLYAAFKEVKVIARVGEIVFPISFFITVLATIALIYLVKLDNLFPLFNTNFLQFVEGIIAFAGASLVPNLLLINYKGDLTFKDIGKGYLLGSFTVILIMFFILTIYGYEFASMVRFPEYLILKKIDFSSFVTNVENILVMEWIADIVVGSFVCIKAIKDNTNKYWFALIIITLIIGIELFFNKRYENILLIKKYFSYFNFTLLFFALLGKWQKKKRH